MKKLFIFIFIFLFVSGCDYGNSTGEAIKPTTMHPPIQIDDSTPQRIKDLTELAYALERFKQKNHQYPISSKDGKGYDALIADEKYGTSRTDWIPGLAPDYISELPLQPKYINGEQKYYIYRSNGANYKLIASVTNQDCLQVRAVHPELIDKRRNCWAYGYWTTNANDW